ncbi:MAG: FtsX-like permease family protein [Bacteroidota bacterium]|nr:ABC transporter permease [Candidatus Kapabacteria bacterium]MDW8271493.1 FtsX-like permease family protein [Bacteroidota bacterium]
MRRLAAWFALRYIRNRRSVQFSGLIAGLGLVGITIGVAAVICVASIFLGFRVLFEDLMLRVDPHVRIVSKSGKYLPSPDSLRQRVMKSDPSAIVALVTDGKAIALFRRSLHVVHVRGYDASTLGRIHKLAQTIIVGTMPRNPTDVVIGAGAAERLGVLPGDTITLISPEYLRVAALGIGLPSSLPVRIAGIAITNDRTYDNTLVLTSQHVAHMLFAAMPHAATQLDVFCTTTTNGERLAALLRADLDQQYRILTWRDLHRAMYAVMEWERVTSFLVLSLIVLLAVFNIVAMLTMTVVSKQRDIAVLLTLGATATFIGTVFRYQGLIVGAIGTLLGAILGIGLCLGQQQFHWILLNTDQYIMQELPVELDWTAAIAVAIVSIGASFLASLPPARRAMRTSIADSLRFE